MADATAGKSRGELVKMVSAARARLGTIRKKANEAAGQILQTLEIGATAFGLSYLRGRMSDDAGQWQVFNVDPELIAAIGLHGLGFLGGEYGEHLHNLGDGALAAFLVNKGLDFGVKAKQSSTQGAPRQMNAGYPQGYAGSGSAFDLSYIGQAV